MRRSDSSQIAISTGKIYAWRLIGVKESMSEKFFNTWAEKTPESLQAHGSAIQELRQIKWLIFEKGGMIRMNPIIQEKLKEILAGPPVSVYLSSSSSAPSEAVLRRHSKVQWDRLLDYMVNAGRTRAEDHSRELLYILNFMKLAPTDKASSHIFQFIMLDQRTQLWKLIIGCLQYSNSKEKHSDDMVALIQFIFSLGDRAVGDQLMFPASVSKQMRGFAVMFHAIGLLYCQFDRGLMYVTPLSLLLFAPDPSALKLSLSDEPVQDEVGKYRNGIVVQSNFKVYAYTDSTLQLGLLRMFVELTHGSPNLAIGVFTREKVTQALKDGISAAHMISFLESNAHRSMSQGLPANIRTQLLVWESDRSRLTVSPVALLQWDPAIPRAFVDRVIAEARRLGPGVIWKHPSRNIIAVHPQIHKALLQFASQLRLPSS